jgi:hypothetical protein
MAKYRETTKITKPRRYGAEEEPAAPPQPAAKPAKKERDDEKILDEARERYNLAVEAEREIREEAILDLKFLAGEQWDEKDAADRKRAFRPVLTFNKLAPMVQSVSNQVRQNKPAIKVHPEDGTARKETAQVLQGLIRHIEYASNADVAYDSAVESSAGCGFGYFRYITEYVNDEGFDQEIKVERILDPFSVYMDSNAKKADRSDAMWAFVIDRWGKEEYKAKYGDPDATGVAFADEWADADQIQVAEYWVVDIEPRTRNQYADGSTGWADEEEEDDPREVVNSREVDQRKVKQYIINGSQILEENEWPGKWIPIVPVWGKEMIVEGKRKLFSLIRFARDPQQLYNYYKTSIAETLSLANRAPYIGYEGQFTDPKWKNANTQNYPYLEVRKESIGGQPAPFPQRQQAEPPIMALSHGAMLEADDIKSTIGIFDPSLGAESNENSGVAIARRQNQANVVNFHFPDNLTRAQVFGGRILLDLIPRIYDTARQVRIVGDDEKAKVVMVNAPYFDEETHRQTTHMLDAGRYGATVTTGPSYTTQREEAFDMLTQMAGGNPQIMQIAGDIIFRNSDIPGADELADRWEKTLPPALQPKKPGQQAPIPPQLVQQMQASGQMIDQLTAKVHELANIIQTKQIENDSRERIAAMNAQVTLIQTQAQLDAKSAETMLKGELQAITTKLQTLTAAHLQQADQDHQLQLQQNDQQHQAGMAQQQQQAEQQQQEPDGDELPAAA